MASVSEIIKALCSSEIREEGSPERAEGEIEEPYNEDVKGEPDESSENRENKIVDLLISEKHVFLSGSGGTGKSYCLKNIYNKLLARGQTVYKTGSTGVASESIGGMTLHSWAGVQLGNRSAETYHISIQGKNKKALKRWKETDVLIIDEISMTGALLFQMLCNLGKLIRKNKSPFGGITLLMCGDACQLPPVNDEYFFLTEAYSDLNPVIVRLKHPWRFQNDIEFFDILSRVRVGKCTDYDIQRLNERKDAYYKEIYNKKYKENDIRPTRMFSKKVDVDEMNRKELSMLNENEYVYVCSDVLQKKSQSSTAVLATFQDLMDKNVPPEVVLKKNAQVMLTWNLDVERGLCNGSRGVVIECLDDCVFVKFKNGIEQIILPNVWTNETEDEIFKRVQIPLALAWCSTIHRCQSATLDSVVIDLGTSIFSDNMAYVALSRCRTLNGIYIVNLIPDKIKCDPVALDFENTLINLDVHL